MISFMPALIFSTLLVFVGVSHAEVRCEALFEKKVRLQLGLESLEQLKKENLFINDKDELIDTLTNVAVGQVRVISPKYLYEWASVAENKDWVRQNGITKEDMNFILESEPQIYGKGYYVSLNPFDSKNYGPVLTVFETTKPLLVLLVDNSIPRKYMTAWSRNTDKTKRLRSAGIAGHFLGGRLPWMSVIDESQLKIARSPIQDAQFDKVFMDLAAQPDLQKEFALRLANSDLLSSLSPESLFRKKYFDQLDVKEFVKDVEETNPIGTAKSRFKNLIEVLKDQKDIHLENLVTALGTHSAAVVSNTLKYFDLFTLSALQKGKLNGIPSVQYAANRSSEMSQHRKKIKLEKIYDFRTFHKAMTTLIGKEPRVRNYSVVMGSEHFKTANTLIMSHREYSLIKDQNAFLTKNLVHKTSSKAEVEVEYMTLAKITELKLYEYFPIELKQKIARYVERNGDKNAIVDREMTALEKSLLRESLEELTNALLKPQSQLALEIILAFDKSKKMTLMNFQDLSSQERVMRYYSAFISIHPFADGNGRASRLYYEWISRQLTGEADVLELAKFDLDTFLPPEQLPLFGQVSKVLNAWIASSRSTAEFQERLQAAKEIILEWYPEYRSFIEN